MKADRVRESARYLARLDEVRAFMEAQAQLAESQIRVSLPGSRHVVLCKLAADDIRRACEREEKMILNTLEILGVEF